MTERPAPTASDPLKVSVVIPALDEADSIASVVASVVAELDDRGYAHEVLVVAGRSRDDTAAVARNAGARVVAQPIPGYGAACIRGIEEAGGDVLVFMDGDGTYDPAVLPRFIEPLRSGYDVVVGTRRNGQLDDGAIEGVHLHFLEPLQNFLFRRWSRSRVSDVRSGMRSMTRQAARSLDLTATGMEFASEMLVEAAHAGMEIAEVAVPFRPRRGPSRRSAGDSWGVIRHLMLMSPSRLFLGPGLFFLFAGLLLEALLLPGPLRLGRLTLNYHFMFVGSASAILGLQLLVLGLFAKTWALVRRPAFADPWVLAFHRRYTLERGLLVAGGVFLAGVLINGTILHSWLQSGGADFFAVRPAVFGLTLMVMGAEVAFAALFLSVLRTDRFGRP